MLFDVHSFKMQVGALSHHAEADKPMISTKSGRPGRYQVIGKFMVEGCLWLEDFGLQDFCAELGVYLKRHHKEQLAAQRSFRGR